MKYYSPNLCEEILHEIEWKNNGFLFTTPNICRYILGVGKSSWRFFNTI